MNSEKSTLTEFLAESNKVLSSSDFGGSLYDLFVPIRSYLQSLEDLLSFSFCRLFGGSVELAFWSEWQTQAAFLTHSSGDLLDQNQTFWRKKVPVKLRGIPGLFAKIDQDIHKVFLPKQLAFLQEKKEEMQTKLVSKSPEIAKYLNSNYLNKITIAQFGKSQLLYNPNINLSQFLEYLSFGSSFLKIGLPILIALRSQNTNSEINWLFVEEITKDLSCLYQISNSLDLAKFLYLQNLSETESFDWWQKNDSQAFQILIGQKEIQKEIQNHQEKYQNKIQNDIARSQLSREEQNLLLSLVNWAKG